MIRRTLLALAALLLSPALAAAQDTAAPALPRVALETSAGRITIEVEAIKAPITAANFLRYVDERRLDGAAFYRAMQSGPGTGLVQGGVNNDPERVLPPIAHEPTTQTGLSHIDGNLR